MLTLRRSLFCCLLAAASVRGADATTPGFQEIYDLLRTNLSGVSSNQLDAAAANGLLRELSGRVQMVDNETPAAATNAGPLAAALVYDGQYVCFRVASVEAGLDAALRAAYQQITQTNKARIKGVILDLRFASGDDYAAAGAAANCFLSSNQPLLQWESGSARSSEKTNAISAPVALLVNAKTSGAAEALAAVLRAADRGLALGAKTPGQASIFREFPLSNGRKLRVATAEIKLADGTTLADGLTPDIPVASSVEDDRAYMDNPYKDLHPTILAHPEESTNTAATDTSNHRRFNEAELVREQRAGVNSDDDDAVTAPLDAPTPPSIADPALARALDLLKGLAVIQGGKPG